MGAYSRLGAQSKNTVTDYVLIKSIHGNREPSPPLSVGSVLFSTLCLTLTLQL